MSHSSSEEHRRKAHARGAIPVAVLTVSDTRSESTDVNGGYLREAIPAAGHVVAAYRLVPDEPEAVRSAIDDLVAAARVLLINGGTGISQRDRTYEVVTSRLQKILPGFGELFRMLSYEQVGSAAMLSRAVAGIYRDAAVFSTPGSPAAVRLAWERLIAPELAHFVSEIDRG